jgi:hypothetical protein
MASDSAEIGWSYFRLIKKDKNKSWFVGAAG